jgi:HK97 family phage portal protein
MFDRLRKSVSRLVSLVTSGVRAPGDWFVDWVQGQRKGKIKVTQDTALNLPEVWYALTRIAGHVGSLPIHLYKRDGERNKSKARKHPAWRLMHTRPNPLMSASIFKETLQVHALLRGNGRAWIDRDAAGNPIELNILPADTKTVLVNGQKWHVANIQNVKNELEEVAIPDSNVLHIIGLSFDGLVGLDLVYYAADSWGMGLAGLRTSKKAFENYGVPGMLLSAPAGMFKTEKEAAEFLDRFRSMQEGPDNAGKTALLRNGIEATVMNQTVAELQLIESRKSSRQDAALWFLLESILGDDTSVSYNSLEQKMLAYLSNCLLRWLVRWEQECDEKLLTNRQKTSDSHYHRFATGALLRTDMKSQAEYLSKLIASRVMNPNDARDLLEMNEYEGGDEYANPAITIGQPGQTSSDTPVDPKTGE